MTKTKGRDYKEYHGRNRADCNCPDCTGESDYLEGRDRADRAFQTEW